MKWHKSKIREINSQVGLQVGLSLSIVQIELFYSKNASRIHYDKYELFSGNFRWHFVVFKSYNYGPSFFHWCLERETRKADERGDDKQQSAWAFIDSTPSTR